MSKCIETIRSVRMEKILKQAWASCAKLRLRSSLKWDLATFSLSWVISLLDLLSLKYATK